MALFACANTTMLSLVVYMHLYSGKKNIKNYSFIKRLNRQTFAKEYLFNKMETSRLAFL